MKTCRDCGSEFKRSPADTTVRCPACRKRLREARENRGLTGDAWAAAELARYEERYARAGYADGFAGRAMRRPESEVYVREYERGARETPPSGG